MGEKFSQTARGMCVSTVEKKGSGGVFNVRRQCF